MTTSKRITAVALAFVLALGLTLAQAQDSSVQGVIYRQRQTGLLKDQAGGGVALNQRFHVTIANVNAGATLLAAIPGYKYRMIDAAMIAVGGAVGTCTTVAISSTQATSAVKLVDAAIAALTQSALLRAGATNATILANGASFAQNDTAAAVTIGKTGGTCDTATHVDVILSYAIE